MSPDTDPASDPPTTPTPRHASQDHDLRYGELRGPLDARAVHDLEAEEAEPFQPLGSEEPTAPAEPPGTHDAHAAIARSLHPPPREPPPVPLRLRAEADAFFSGAMHAYTAGDLPGARLSLLAVVAIGAPESAPASMVFLGVIAGRRRDFGEAYLWFTRASNGPDEHWALVADQELRRMG